MHVIWAFICMVLVAMPYAEPVAAEQPQLRPYTARYAVSYRGLEGGEIEISLQHAGGRQYRFSSHLFPNFLGSLFASDQAEDSSLLELTSEGIRPLQFRSEDGTSGKKKDIHLDFDWSRNKVAGRVGEHAFELDVPNGAQERMSIQLAASLALQAGREPGKLIMVEKDQVQEYTIKREGTDHTRVPAGEYEATILSSQRSGSSRVTRYWYAPALNYLPARAERTTKGKVDIVMQLRSFKFDD